MQTTDGIHCKKTWKIYSPRCLTCAAVPLFLTLSPPLPCFYFCFLLPAFRPPSRRERGQEREYQIQTLSSSSSFSTPLAQNNSSNPKRVPESYWTGFCVYVCAHVDVCAASGLDQDTLLCTAGSGSSRQLPRNVETRYIRPRSGLGLLKILVPKTREQKSSGGRQKV